MGRQTNVEVHDNVIDLGDGEGLSVMDCGDAGPVVVDSRAVLDRVEVCTNCLLSIILKGIMGKSADNTSPACSFFTSACPSDNEFMPTSTKSPDPTEPPGSSPSAVFYMIAPAAP
ncbi:hypothetical protein BDD12DRAFT_984067 [Trichophaea hybrida]|nr:hypothetical protein BDD12DRAFT_984067 [Trichophaea hybrida]